MSDIETLLETPAPVVDTPHLTVNILKIWNAQLKY